MKAKQALLALLALTSTRSGTIIAQALPTTQPAYLTIVREEVKLGRDAEHTRIEAGWPAAFAKAKSPSSYLALVSLTGRDGSGSRSRSRPMPPSRRSSSVKTPIRSSRRSWHG